MKKFWLFGMTLLILTVGCIVYVQEPYDQPPYEDEYGGTVPPAAGDVDLGYFYEALTPYGYWVDTPSLGYVWVPHTVEFGWRPYTRGRWAWTDYGWTWVSEFRWGWAPFHYGRWGWDDDFGWFWVPGSVWAPAWVSWRYSTSYIGWAPLPPGVRFIPGVGITSFPPDMHFRFWVFVDGRSFYGPGVYRYILPWERNPAIISRTVIRTRIVMHDRWIVNQGLDLDYARRVTRHSIHKVQLADARGPGADRLSGESVEMYRPRVSEGATTRPRSTLSRPEVKDRVSVSRIRRTTGSETTGIESRQRREVRLLEESQERESRDLQIKAESDKRKAVSSEEKRKIDREYESKAVRLKKEHEEEKSQVEDRHKTERTKVSKTRVSKTAVKKKKK